MWKACLVRGYIGVGGRGVFLVSSTTVGNVSHYLTRRRFRVAML